MVIGLNVNSLFFFFFDSVWGFVELFNLIHFML